MLSRFERGMRWEDLILALLRSWGYDARKTTLKAPYDIVLHDVVFVEVKSGLVRDRAIHSAREALKRDMERYLAIAVWGPLTSLGLGQRGLVFTKRGTFPLTLVGFRKALESINLPSDPRRLSRFAQSLLSLWLSDASDVLHHLEPNGTTFSKGSTKRKGDGPIEGSSRPSRRRKRITTAVQIVQLSKEV